MLLCTHLHSSPYTVLRIRPATVAPKLFSPPAPFLFHFFSSSLLLCNCSILCISKSRLILIIIGDLRDHLSFFFYLYFFFVVLFSDGDLHSFANAFVACLRLDLSPCLRLVITRYFRPAIHHLHHLRFITAPAPIPIPRQTVPGSGHVVSRARISIPACALSMRY